MKYISIAIIGLALCQVYMLFLIMEGLRETANTNYTLKCVAWCADNGMTQVHTKDGCFCVDSDGQWPRIPFWEPDAPVDQLIAERIKLVPCLQGK